MTLIYRKNTLGDFLYHVFPQMCADETLVVENKGGNKAVDLLLKRIPRNAGNAGPTRLHLIAYFRHLFYQDPLFKLHPVTIHIGSINKNRSSRNNNLLYQDRIADILIERQCGFNIIGYSAELVSPRLTCLLASSPRVLNFLDKTDNIFDLINILFHSKLVLVRNTGVLHLAGLCNVPIITLYANCRIPDDLAVFFQRRPNIKFNGPTERTHLWYTEKWSPVADHVVSIIEYRVFDICGYNERVSHLIGHYLDNPLDIQRRQVIPSPVNFTYRFFNVGVFLVSVCLYFFQYISCSLGST